MHEPCFDPRGLVALCAQRKDKAASRPAGSSISEISHARVGLPETDDPLARDLAMSDPVARGPDIVTDSGRVIADRGSLL